MAILDVLAIMFAVPLTLEAAGFLFRHLIARRIDSWAEKEIRKEAKDSSTQIDHP